MTDLSREEQDEVIKGMVEYSQEGDPAVPYKQLVDSILRDEDYESELEIFVRDIISSRLYDNLKERELNSIERSDKSFGWIVGFILPENRDDDWSTTDEDIEEEIDDVLLASIVKRMNRNAQNEWNKIMYVFDQLVMQD